MNNRWRQWRQPLYRFTFKRKLLLYLLLLGVLPVFVVGSIASGFMTKNIQDEVNNNHRIILRHLGEQIDDMLLGFDRTIVQLAGSRAIQQSLINGMGADQLQLSQSMIDTMMGALAHEQIPLKMSLYYTRYSAMYSTQHGIVRDIDYPYSAIVRAAQVAYGGSFYISPNTYPNVEDMFFVRAVPLHSTDPLGFLIAQMNKDGLRQFLDKLELGEGRKVMIVDDKGEIVAKQHVPGVGERLQRAGELYPFWEGGQPYTGTIKIDSVSYNVTTIPSLVMDWTFIALTPVSELSAKANNILLLTRTIIVGILLVWTIAAAIVSRSLYRPIQLLAEKFSSASQGKDKDILRVLDTMMESMKNRNERLQLELNDHKPYRKELILQHLLIGATTREETNIAAKEFELFMEERWFYIAVAQFEHEPFFAMTGTDKERAQYMRKLYRFAERSCESLENQAYAVAMPGHVAMLFGVAELGGKPFTDFLEICDNVRTFASTTLQVPVSVAVSNPRYTCSGISECYQEAVGFLKYRWTLGYRTTINSSFLARSDPKSLRMLARWKTSVVISLMQNDVAGATEHLSRLVESLPNSLRQSDAAAGVFSMIASEIGQSLKERGDEIDELFEYDISEYICRLRTREEMMEWFEKELFSTVASCLTELPAEGRRTVMPTVLSYIHAHYESDISLQRLADIGQVSTTSLSRMFKEEMGINYLEYVIHLRMNKAKEWLADTELSINEIAQRLQYTTVQNFNRIFKQTTGVTPGMFRKLAGEATGKNLTPDDSPSRRRSKTI
ncbi:helix-turn-helix domain-containing protein [Paenibacillus sp. GCM10012303]|uniref:helix-turn-helix domain-containing protein n=1 Tax=Paenibacillus sp. GCM10012303 TaxID=3317340 RepID=UPI003623DBF1